MDNAIHSLEAQETTTEISSVAEWLHRVRPFYGGQEHLIREIRAVGIKNTFEIVQLLEQAKSASFKFSMGGLAGQVRAPARRSEYLTRVEKAS